MNLFSIIMEKIYFDFAHYLHLFNIFWHKKLSFKTQFKIEYFGRITATKKCLEFTLLINQATESTFMNMTWAYSFTHLNRDEKTTKTPVLINRCLDWWKLARELFTALCRPSLVFSPFGNSLFFGYEQFWKFMFINKK